MEWIENLGSPTPLVVAQAAYRLSEMRSTSVNGEVQNALRRSLVRQLHSASDERDTVILHLLDALVQTGGHASVDILRALPEEFDDLSLVLASRAPGKSVEYESWLGLVLKRSTMGARVGMRGIAAGNMLAAMGSARIVDLAVIHAKPELLVHVVDEELRGMERSASTTIATYRVSREEGDPPIPTYSLMLSGFRSDREGYHLLAAGDVVDVWYRRGLVNGKRSFVCYLAETMDVGELAFGWLTMLLRRGPRIVPVELPMKYRVTVYHKWATAGEFLRFVEEQRTKAIRRDAELAESLVKSGLVPAGTAVTGLIETVVRVEDRRAGSPEELEELPAMGGPK